ncbi:gliding motility-associated ABC transporter substrate-binding protein GldG [Fibrella sp. WM1]|uniref:gliding motility-associated ABC transporter substrate-binding protein GldG n=1 Tax=Fibrella musci TaxID=3242485 RepID=UPI00351FC7DC
MSLSTKRFLGLLLGLVVINLLSAFVYARLDLTSDKRYTLTDGTRRLLTTLPARVHVDVYLTGNLPPGFRRLETAVRETLEGFKAEGESNISYRFIDPITGTTAEQNKRLEELAALGLQPTNLFANQGGKRTEQLVVPGAVVHYEGKQLGVLLLKGNKAASPEEQLNQSYEGVEYQLASAIRRLTQPEGSRRRVGLVFGHTQVPPERFSDILASIQETYDLFFVDLRKPGPVEGVDALLVLKPDQPFVESEVFKLDQYVVKGGRALFVVDGQRIDSVGTEGSYAQPLVLGLDDLFFNWGARVNKDVVKDLNCGVIPLNVGNMGDKPNIQLVPWRFYPVLNSFGDGPITRNLDAIYGRFASTIDTVRANGIRKTVLLKTSAYTQVLKTPTLVTYNEARQQPDPATYLGGVRSVGTLLEGSFTSLFANQILPDSLKNGYRETGAVAKVLLCSDGDLVVNDVDYKRKAPLPLGYDRFTRTQFANKDFVLNAIDYLVDPEGLIMARQREVPLRPLDNVKIGAERTQWQGLNVLGPLALVLAMGLIWQAVRRRQYAR